ncbi:MAG: fructose-bisphosphate aldolase class I [Chlamydiales bacterium]|nr:fructose-bisphosphate aldolase class I [Chlamydiales bacterium]
MDTNELKKTATALVANNKGLLAMDESMPTCNKRFSALGIPLTEEARRSYRDMILTTPKLSDSISGVILFDETIYQATKAGKSFVEVCKDNNIIPGIKVDTGAVELAGHPGEKITEGLDGLRARLKKYSELGAKFAKWRAVITIGNDIPSAACIDANATQLSLYAALCQEAGIVPIVEPEVLMDGDHTIEACYSATQKTLQAVFAKLRLQNVLLEGMLLKPNMVVPGLKCAKQDSTDVIADMTVKCLIENVPAKVAGVVFLSGGQSAEDASLRLNAMQVRHGAQLPWPLSFSFARAIQQPALELWRGQDANVKEAQIALEKRAHANFLARSGKYTT